LPELFGVMQIVYSLRTGAELISDVGIGQNIIYNKNANDPDFYNTAWSLQLVRGIVLWAIFCAAAVPVAKFYGSSILAPVMSVAALAFILFGLSSTSRFLLQKRMKYDTITIFETAVALAASVAQVTLAYFSPTIWALVVGALAGAATATIGSHFLLPDVRQRLFFSRKYAAQIMSFGKWIFASSIIYFLSTNFDRLYLAKAIPLQLLGVYGIARTLSELLSALVQRLGSNVIFPFLASHSQMARTELYAQLAPIRMKFLLVAGVGFSLFASTADLVVDILYDQRYHAASWMLPVLIIGGWFAIMSNINESSLMGLGRPNYSVFGNGAKFGFLLIGLSWGVARYGVLGGVVAVAMSEFGRYVPILVGQVREGFSFRKQDLLATVAVFMLIAFWEWLRWAFGFGTSFDALPAELFRIGR
jgi:O-antigen/teichoic acid export membrane protein